uniref:Transmembrane protein n=1 Tax=Panagrellus redivivus TaxID=6233 RepID=A0A7E4W1B6_PANRE
MLENLEAVSIFINYVSWSFFLRLDPHLILLGWMPIVVFRFLSAHFAFATEGDGLKKRAMPPGRSDRRQRQRRKFFFPVRGTRCVKVAPMVTVIQEANDKSGVADADEQEACSRAG